MEKLAIACTTEVGKSFGSFTIAAADEFSYTDPETQETVEKQGIRFMAEDGSRFVFRLSGTSSTNGESQNPQQPTASSVYVLPVLDPDPRTNDRCSDYPCLHGKVRTSGRCPGRRRARRC